MRHKVRSVSAGVLITISFVFVVGMLSSIAMMTVENAAEHMALISAIFTGSNRRDVGRYGEKRSCFHSCNIFGGAGC